MTAARRRYVADCSPDRVYPLGAWSNGCEDWEIWQSAGGYWEAFHPDVEYAREHAAFDTWRETMDFVDEYMRVAEWAAGMERTDALAAALGYSDLIRF